MYSRSGSRLELRSLPQTAGKPWGAGCAPEGCRASCVGSGMHSPASCPWIVMKGCNQPHLVCELCIHQMPVLPECSRSPANPFQMRKLRLTEGTHSIQNHLDAQQWSVDTHPVFALTLALVTDVFPSLTSELELQQMKCAYIHLFIYSLILSLIQHYKGLTWVNCTEFWLLRPWVGKSQGTQLLECQEQGLVQSRYKVAQGKSAWGQAPPFLSLFMHPLPRFCIPPVPNLF